ncbi:hypothetical protein NQF86_08365 [Bombella sp. TMW 2.2543]|uniref:Site-specific DNA-methyltransferase (cytosine-N(4)-specific) n=1 Tax=Bombella pluederhausensis TaxID=2967336 RepID=A0ABT3WPE2_9PROT|nr:hypothetical protein [Bombella pluederhausensis]MCX5618671.1 hypothetical protein [Bombella pluederhausensis]
MRAVSTRQLDYLNKESDLCGVGIRNGSSIDIAPLDATFRDSNRAPLHSWFPYLEGYSPRFVQSVMQEYLPKARSILEPFAGSGTTPIVLGQLGIECAYSEANPVMAFIIQTKLEVLRMNRNERRYLSNRISVLNRHIPDLILKSREDTVIFDNYISAFGSSVYFDSGVFNTVLKLRTVVDKILEEDHILGKCLLLAVFAILIPVSRLKRAGDLRFKTSKELAVGSPCIMQMISERLMAQASDIALLDDLYTPATFACDNAADLHKSVEGLWDGIITSPPYLNGTNYIRNARLELWFHRKIKSKVDLRSLRDKVITSGINDVDLKTEWRPVTAGVAHVVAELERKAYDQRISKMVGGYFHDMKVAMTAMAACLCKTGRLCIDIGDSIYAGVHVPTDDLLIEVAEGIGLCVVERVHLRKRTSKGGQPLHQQLLVFEK